MGKNPYFRWFIIVGIGLFALYTFMQRKKATQTTVAVVQIVEHPSLDAERKEILSVLQKEGVHATYHNAQGNMSTAAQIAQQVTASKPSVIVAISTSMAQSLVSLCEKNDIPLIYTAVTDPASAKLGNVMGVSDAVPPESPWQMIKHCQPNASKVGIIYNAGEVNSVYMVGAVAKVAPDMGFHVEVLTIHKSSDVAQAVQTLIARGVEALYIPNDNMAVSAIASIVAIAHPAGVPVYASDEGSVANGAVAAYAYSRKDLGHQAAMLVLHKLGHIPSQPQSTPPLTLFVNQEAQTLFPKFNWDVSSFNKLD